MMLIGGCKNAQFLSAGNGRLKAWEGLKLGVWRQGNSIHTQEFEVQHACFAIRGLTVNERSRGRGLAPAYV